MRTLSFPLLVYDLYKYILLYKYVQKLCFHFFRQLAHCNSYVEFSGSFRDRDRQ